MWSDSNRDYVNQLVESNREEYPYYIAHTCTYWNITNSAALPTFKVYFSKDPITATDIYNYTLSENSMVYNVIAGNASNNYHSQRVTTSSFSGNLKIDNYEFVYSNAEYSTRTIQPDITSTNTITRAEYQGVNLILIAILLGIIVYKLIRGK